MLRHPIVYSFIGFSLLIVGCAGLYLHSRVEKPYVATVATVELPPIQDCTTVLIDPTGKPHTVCSSLVSSLELRISLSIAPLKPHTNEVAILTASTKLSKDTSYKLFGSLNSVGVEMDPKGLVAFTSTGKNPELYTASWAIRAKEPHTYPIIFTPILKTADTAKSSKAESSASLVDASTVDDPPRATVDGSNIVVFDVISKWTDYFAKGWPPFVAFMGSLLTLPGILSYLESRRKGGLRPDPEPTEPLPF